MKLDDGVEVNLVDRSPKETYRPVREMAALVIEVFSLDAYDNAIFLFCGTRSDRFKALYWDKTGFVLYYKRIESGRFQWPRNQIEAT